MYDFEGNRPSLDVKTFVADGARIIGKVTIKEYTSVWFNSVIRGDVNRIEIGCYSNVQDGSIIHVADQCPTIIGDFVSIGHNATVHGCTIENNCLIGIGAIVMNGAVIGEGSIIGAGTLVLENQIIPPHSLVVGVPGKIIKTIPEAWERIHAQAVKYKSVWTERYGLMIDADGERYHGERIV